MLDNFAIINITLISLSFAFILEGSGLLKRWIIWIIACSLISFFLFTPLGIKMTQGVFALTGELSITSYSLLLVLCISKTLKLKSNYTSEKNIFYSCIAIIGITFYTLALGISPFDPYRLGYQAIGLSIIIAILTVILAWKNQRIYSLILTLALVSYSQQILLSTNLWDYLIDPFLVIAAIIKSTNSIFQKSFNSKTKTTSPNGAI